MRKIELMSRLKVKLPPKWKLTSILAISFSLSFTVVLFMPLDMYLHNPNDFVVSWKFILPGLLLFSFAGFTALSVINIALWQKSAVPGAVLLLLCGASVIFMRLVFDVFISTAVYISLAIAVAVVIWAIIKKLLKEKEGVILEISIGGENGHAVQGPAYFSQDFSDVFKVLLEEYYTRPESNDYYWEHILKDELKRLPPMYVKDTTGIVHEFENLGELRRFDTSYFEETNNLIMQTISNVFKCSQGDVSGISVIKNGMSNRSFKFYLDDKSYVFRLPGADTGKLVNRKTEKEANTALAPYHLTDEVLYFDGGSGIKISKFFDDCHDSDPYNDEELKIGMERLSEIHSH